MNFKPGDRVTYNNEGHCWHNRKGSFVTSFTGSETAVVLWDVTNIEQTCDEKRLKLIEEKPMIKVGDRVVYEGTGKEAMTAYNGRTATVKAIRDDSVDIVWDADVNVHYPYYTAMRWNVKLAPVPTKEEIDKALSTLKAAGDVTFKPRKPPFDPIKLPLNSEYSAIVTEGGVNVGCQHFTFGVIEQVWDAVRKAKDYARS